MSKVSSIENPVEVGGEYHGQVLRVEPHGIEQVSASERHGSPRTLFTLWLSANMGLPVWLVGALAIILGLGFADGVIAILVGTREQMRDQAFAPGGDRSDLAALTVRLKR
jgi:NCS1 family nucleobase:cation symporter-1